MEKKTYTKLSNLVNGEFTVIKAWGFGWKKWNDQANKMEISDTYKEGFRKVYQLDTDKGTIDLGSGQLSSLLEAVYRNGVANLNGRTFTVKSNGKTGMDVRYFFNAIKETQPVGEGFKKFQQAKAELKNDVVLEDIDEAEPYNLADIPF